MLNDYIQNLAQKLRVSINEIANLNAAVRGDRVYQWLNLQESRYEHRKDPVAAHYARFGVKIGNQHKHTDALVNDITRVLNHIIRNNTIYNDHNLRLLAWYLLNTDQRVHPDTLLTAMATLGYDTSIAITQRNRTPTQTIISEALNQRNNRQNNL